MAFDMGFNYRSMAGYVTDPAYGVPVLLEIYPHTYTNGNGDSINAGWDSFPGDGGKNDLDNTNDARIAGQNYHLNTGTPLRFKVDLSSGSAPGAGDYTIDVAVGHAAGGGQTQDFKVEDTATVLIDGTNGGSGIAVAEDHYVDATLADIAATATWTGTSVAKSFATTLAQLGINYDNLGGTYTTLAHFRLTLVAAVQPPSGLLLLGAGRG